MTLILERRSEQDRTTHVGSLTLTPLDYQDYWSYRIRLSDKQAIVGFPKFGTIGVGFAVEEDWNTNLPYTSGTDAIFEHIVHNKGDEAIADSDVREAIRLVQEAATADRSVTA